MIYFANPKSEYDLFKTKINKKITQILNSNSYILNEVKEFEKNFSRYLKIKYSIGVSNGTDALILALKAINIKKGDHIITTSHTAFATISAIVETGAVPVFVDIKEEDFTINTTELIKKLQKNQSNNCHIYGNPADIKEISKIAKRKKIVLIEDCAQAHGAEIEKKNWNIWAYINF